MNEIKDKTFENKVYNMGGEKTIGSQTQDYQKKDILQETPEVNPPPICTMLGLHHYDRNKNK